MAASLSATTQTTGFSSLEPPLSTMFRMASQSESLVRLHPKTQSHSTIGTRQPRPISKGHLCWWKFHATQKDHEASGALAVVLGTRGADADEPDWPCCGARMFDASIWTHLPLSQADAELENT